MLHLRQLTCPASWCWLAPVSPGSEATAYHRHRLNPNPGHEPDRSQSPEEEPQADTGAETATQTSRTLAEADAVRDVLTLLSRCFTCLCSVRESISDRTQPTLPSPPQTRILNVSNFWKSRRLTHKGRCERFHRGLVSHTHTHSLTHPRCGPPFIRSNTCAGFSSCLKRRRNLTP